MDTTQPPVAELWADLKRAAARRARKETEHEEANAECRRAVVALLKAGVRPSDLYGNPYSAAYVSRIQKDEGLTRAARSAKADSK